MEFCWYIQVAQGRGPGITKLLTSNTHYIYIQIHAYIYKCIHIYIYKYIQIYTYIKIHANKYILAEFFSKCLKWSYFLDCCRVSYVVLVFMNVGERSTAKNYRSVSLVSVIRKDFEKFLNNRIVDHLEKCGLFFLISSMVLGLLDQLQIFLQLYLVELLVLLTGLGLCELYHLIYPRSLTGFGMLDVFTNLSLMEVQFRYSAFFFFSQ